ncbi:MAG: hypothetical protein PWQ70_2700 [Clostridiales bacterium]|nr:hypothetical protein [Clostridiales bacterium]
MNYPVVTDTNGQKLAILNSIINPIIFEKINGEYTFTFTTLVDEFKTDYINCNNLIEIDNNIFQISKVKKIHTNDNKTMIDVYCEHISYTLIDDTLDSFKLENVTATQALQTLLQDTAFVLDTCNVAGTNTIDISDSTNKRAVLNGIANIFGGEYQFDKYKISLLVQRGQNRGVQFRIGKNLKYVSKEIDATVKDNEGNAKVTYEIEIIELNELQEFKGLEGFVIGDTVRIIDDDLQIDVYARIVEVEYNPLERRNTRVVLSNFIENLATASIDIRKTSNLVASRSKIWNRAEAISEKGTFYTELLEGTINTLQNEVKAGLGTVHITDNNGILITDQPTIENSTKAIRLLGGMFAIANQKDINGNWIWRTFGDGDGFTADLILTGTLAAERIGAGSITVGHLAEDVQSEINTAQSTADNALTTANNVNDQLSQNVNPKLTKITNEGIYTGTVQTNQLVAGIIDTNTIKLQSTDGNLKIEANEIKMTNTDGSEVIINPTDGLQIIFEKDANGNPYSYTTYDAQGQKRYFRGARVATFFMSASGEDSSTSENYALLELPGENWYQFALAYNDVIYDDTKTAQERYNICRNMLSGMISIKEIDRTLRESEMVHKTYALFKKISIDTSSYKVIRIYPVLEGDDVTVNTLGNVSKQMNFKGAVIKARGWADILCGVGGSYLWTEEAGATVNMLINATMDVDY